MKILLSFIITCTVTFMISLFSAILLYILHLDLQSYDHTIWQILIGGIISFFSIPFVYALLFIPIYLFNKAIFVEQEVLYIYERYLFIVILPFIFISISMFEIFMEYDDARIILLNIFISVVSGFYVFIKTIKKNEPVKN